MTFLISGFASLLLDILKLSALTSVIWAVFLITFFLLPPSKKILFDRLSNRDMTDKLIVEERMKQFERDVLHWINYDYVLINDSLEECHNKIKKLIHAEINDGSKDYDRNYIKSHVEKLTS